ncbi:DUF3261 domain-containing protein [Halomonas sp. McH1-25]|uniref:DUF3261 domain-containing protein n=1 Tax=unclassified Halomonas TaxID=2609666 RepID=UPI001EF68B98|nr:MULTISPECIES: DUF3261 domain-containing protein [unclassified Halomonas]MCG7600175.1 DUF3261 domain-containing protein [Halomonas sp. McH1-25]MCP1341424.1 DUF3261 domain-containing protein [Halomonas sp. FL8]MCP1362739.1 DUF3261 domain-containing protein [Halomonas sp. BBD45]MCP1365892.1 DUF3261 domain-containing protein [Halomonas sp. BBD48]
MSQRCIPAPLLVAIGLATLSLAGCSLTPSVSPAPAFQSVAATDTLKRRLTFMPDDESRPPQTLIGLIRIADHELRAVLLTSYGQRLVTLVNDAEGSRYLAGDVPQATMEERLPVPADWLASRLQWSLWPVAALRDAFAGSAWTIEVEDGSRIIRQHGKVVARITPATASAERRQDVLLDDRQGRYRLRISPLEEAAS